MNDKEYEAERRWMRAVCFSLARVTLIVSVTILASEWLFLPKDRSMHLIGSSVFLMLSCVFAMALTRPGRKS